MDITTKVGTGTTRVNCHNRGRCGLLRRLGARGQHQSQRPIITASCTW